MKTHCGSQTLPYLGWQPERDVIALSSKPQAHEQNIWTGRAPLRLGFLLELFKYETGVGGTVFCTAAK